MNLAQLKQLEWLHKVPVETNFKKPQFETHPKNLIYEKEKRTLEIKNIANYYLYLIIMAGDLAGPRCYTTDSDGDDEHLEEQLRAGGVQG